MAVTPGPRNGASTFKDSEGNYWLYGGFGTDFTRAEGYLNDLWKYDLEKKTWIWEDGQMVWDKEVPSYNNALAFDGVDDMVILDGNPVSYEEEFTIETYVAPNHVPPRKTHILQQLTDVADGYHEYEYSNIASGRKLWRILRKKKQDTPNSTLLQVAPNRNLVFAVAFSYAMDMMMND